MRILAASDLHGIHHVYEWLPHVVEDYGAEAIVLAGDLLGVPDDHPTVESAQRASAQTILKTLESVKLPVLYIMGNDDWIELDPATESFRSLHGARLDLGHYSFVGYQYSPPFMGGIHEKPEDAINHDMASLEPLMDDHTVLVTHCPALGILDRAPLGQHAGSPSILRAVQRRSVRAHIHGHIHGCFGRHGRHFNVASAGELRCMVIDLATMHHTIVRRSMPRRISVDRSPPIN